VRGSRRSLVGWATGCGGERPLEAGSRPFGMMVGVSSAEQRVALVTGRSRGLGSAIARRLAHDGLAVAVNGLHEDELVGEVVGTIRGEGGTAAAFTCDVTDAQQVEELVAAIAGRFGPVDVLVLNATGPQPEAPLDNVSWDDHVAQLEFFVKSPVLLGCAVLPDMQAKRSGRIIRLRGSRPAPTQQVRLRRGQERPDRPRPRLGARARPFRRHGEHGGAGLRSRRTPCRRHRRGQTGLRRFSAGRTIRHPRRHRPRCQLLRVRGRKLRHGPTPRRRRRPPSSLTRSPGGEVVPLRWLAND
jgi:hypothetical protein